MKKALIIFLIAIAALAALRFGLGGNEDSWICQNGEWVRHGNPSTEKPIEPCDGSRTGSSGVNFSKTGYLRDQEPQNPNRGMYILYEEPGAPALLAKLTFDGESMCTFTDRRVNCMLLSSIIETTVGDKRIFVEGIKTGDEVLVRNISIDEERYTP